MGRRLASALEAQRSATLDLLRAVPAGDWARPCLPPWRVHDVVAHLVAVDEAAVTRRLLPLMRSGGGADLERWTVEAVAGLADVEPAELLARLAQAGARLAGVVARVPRLAMRVQVRTVYGRRPLAVLVCRRIVDEWVHSADIAASVPAVPAPPTQSAVPRAVGDALATGVLDTLPALVLPRLDVRAGVLRLVVWTGPPDEAHGPRRTWGIDFARRQYGPRVTARPDTTVRLHAATLALLAEGRLRWAEGRVPDVVVEGDVTLADHVLAGLAP